MSSHCVVPSTGQPGTCLAPLSIPQLLKLAYDAGFRGTSLITAVAIALTESSGIPNNVNDSGAYGLWQINPNVGDAQHPAMSAATLNPQENAKLAAALATPTGGPNGQRNFQPWVGGYGAYDSPTNQTLQTNLGKVQKVAALLKPPYSTASSQYTYSVTHGADVIQPNPGLPNPLSGVGFNWAPLAWILVGLVASIVGVYLLTHGHEREIAVERPLESGAGEAAEGAA